MKVLLVLAAITFCASAKTLSLEKEWQNFKNAHRKFYRSLLDEQTRYSIFQENFRKIEEHNALYGKGLKTYELGITQFADLTSEEFKEMLTFKKSEKSERQGRSLFKASNFLIATNKDLKEILAWGDSNQVEFNAKKTQAAVFSKKGNVAQPDSYVGSVDPVSFINQLGVNLGGNMSWHVHVVGLARSASQKLGTHLRIKQLYRVPKKAEIPKSIDWRTKGAVTDVKDQGHCGACWAFSVTGSMEAQYYLKHKKLVSFSEQQLIDCAGGVYDNDGCNGGQFDPAFSYIREKGIETESTYPYEMIDDQCKYNNNSVITKLADYVDVESNDEDALVAAVGLIGPVSVAIDAELIQFYKGGIYQDESCSQNELNHGVLAVGYGSQKGHNYWIIKNSWGRDFGQDGYVYMKRGVNQCGIALQPSYPVL